MEVREANGCPEQIASRTVWCHWERSQLVVKSSIAAFLFLVQYATVIVWK
jgi:hypothetical protein